MELLPIILIIIFVFSLLLNYRANLHEKTAMEIVNEMGIGYNLGNSFDSYNISIKINDPDEQITLLGNPLPTKKLISNIKKSGFKTIRFPVTWINFIDEYGNVNREWMLRVKEVVNWIVNKNIYCIVNIQNDGEKGNWLYDGLNAIEKYINLWSQIAEEFKNINEYLIFESMDNPLYYSIFLNKTGYDILFNLTQAFVDTIRNSGGYNKERLLLISGMDANLEYTCSPYYKIPKDPYNKLAISIHYFFPTIFTLQDNYFSIHHMTWGDEDEYKELLRKFNALKESFTDKNIPVIIGEVGVVTEYNRELSSIREYLYAVLSFSFDYDGIMACLWDTSNKIMGDMNYYDRVNYEWYDKTIQNFIYNISRKKYIHLSDYYHITNFDTTISTSELGDYYIILGSNKPLTIFLNVNATGELFEDYDFSVSSFDKNGDIFDIIFGKENMKRQYDGTIIFTFDVSNLDCNQGIEVINWTGDELIFNNITIEYNESFLFFDYKSYKSEILKEIN